MSNTYMTAPFDMLEPMGSTKSMSVDAANLAVRIAARPRLYLGQLPTPLQEAPRLSDRLGVRVLVKRDDQTGLALGGNKVRKLEFLIADALAQGCDTVVTTGGSQSNHARITAAACRLAGLDCYLVLDRGVHPQVQGNLLLDALLGARVTLVDSAEPAVAVAEMESMAQLLRSEGRHPYIIPRGGSVPVGASGYTAFVPELMEQLMALEVRDAILFLGTGSTGTHSGVLAGMAVLGHPVKVQGISVSRPASDQIGKVLDLSNRTLGHLALGVTVSRDRVLVDDRFRGPAYGVPTPDTWSAVIELARDEGLILDPVYTGKVMAGLLEHAREGRIDSNQTAVFLHTGGAPATFAYNLEAAEALERFS